jgi:transposase InsO family protein
MPWKILSALQARQRFVQAALRGLKSVAQLCRDFEISRKSGFKWLSRYRAFGGPGLQSRSRRPKHSPHRTSTRWLRAIAAVRCKHPCWGAKKIYAHLRRKHRRACLPKTRTITDWLKRLGLTLRRPARARRGPRLPLGALTIPKAPNHVWTVDFKGWFRTRNGQRVDPLTVRDLFSRYLLDVRLLQHGHQPVYRHFQRLFRSYGLPQIVRVDHGPPFAGDGALDLSRLSAWWLRLGIKVQFTGRGRPQDNAAHEQMHKVYQAELVSPPAATPRGQQWRTTRWIEYYNYQRPHEGLDQRTPAQLYHKSRRHYRGDPPEFKYPPNWPTRRVTPSGYVRWRGRVRVIGRAFGQQRVGFKPIAAGSYQVYFGYHLIGELVDTDPGGLRPATWVKTPKVRC